MYSPYGNNFVKTILKHASEKKQLNVVTDQVGTPTYSFDLANAIMHLIPRSTEIREVEIFHYSNEGVASWYDFAKAIVELAGLECAVKPIATQEYPLPAHRPFYSVLNKAKIKKLLNIDIPHWRDSLSDCINTMK